MADNQITPFQLTDQFTMDNFNQRINETNTALQNNDPRQWGLGSYAPKIVSDLNNATQSGWYYVTGDTANRPISAEVSNVCLVLSRNSNPQTVQLLFNVTSTAFELRRVCTNGKWSPWEWVNPPMALGVEYRTTERYLGKPVYVKVVDCGAMPNTTTKTVNHGIANIDQCISASGIATASSGDTFSMPYVSMSDGVTNGCSFSRIQVRVWAAGDNSTASAKVLIKYTKTTD